MNIFYTATQYLIIYLVSEDEQETCVNLLIEKPKETLESVDKTNEKTPLSDIIKKEPSSNVELSFIRVVQVSMFQLNSPIYCLTAIKSNCFFVQREFLISGKMFFRYDALF